MNIKCPHCGTEYDAEEGEYGRFVKCTVCGKGFVVGAVTVHPNATKGVATNVAIDESRSNMRQHSRSRLPAKRRSPWVRTEGAGAAARQLRAHAQEKDNGYRVPTAIIVVGLFIVVGIVASIVLPKLNSVATRVAWKSRQPETMQRNNGRAHQGRNSSSPTPTYETSSSFSSPANAKEAIRGALANVKERYRQNLRRFDLVESLYVDRKDLCQLILVEPIGDTPLYTIRFWKDSKTLEWSRIMSKEIAEQFIHDRMLMDAYEKALSSDK